ncbi:MAG: type I DNA topoisomerase [Proteobacteria bacterium]|nr:type I DNA topoisomerase [Pseudomonadota bacterium]
MSTVVIVESPTKAKTIKDFLPAGYKVVASMGHIRDLPQSASEIPEKVKKEPWSQIGVNAHKDFEPIYVVPKDKKKTLKELKGLLANANELLLATDEDREGESISWHLLEVLKPKVPVKRMVFHEITKEAIATSLKNCREINQSLVRAQETRRILDRLVGYTLSPLLWKKVAAGLSAGRVQSVSVKLLVERERKRRAFHKGSYWDIIAQLKKEKASFQARLVKVQNKKIAVGSDFDENTGQIKKGKKVLLIDEKEARSLESRIQAADWKVLAVEEKKSVRKPSAPFITSTLQQEAHRKLRMSARRTMRVAQTLYERGFITYMRTDSVNLSDQAIKAARKCVLSKYGKEYLTNEPRVFKQSTKGAQEAHEAIRPAGSVFKLPAKTGLKDQELALYDLIWKRTVASQMEEARQVHIKATIEAAETEFQATGKRIEFPGFFRAYVEGSDDPEASLDDKEIILPPMVAGELLNCASVEAKGHETKPPARFTEASLVKKLETEGIGRPSTYATIIDTIVNRGYVEIVSNTLVPSFTAFAMTGLLETHFSDLVDPGFTARMEHVLDEIASNKADWLPYMKEFYLGEKGLEQVAIEKTEKIDAGDFRKIEFEGLGAAVHIGRYGPYIESVVDEERVTVSIPKDITPAELDRETVDRILASRNRGNDELGMHPETDEPIYILTGAYGPYVQLGNVVDGQPKPKRVTLPKGLKEAEVNIEKALLLLSLPKKLGQHPETDGAIVAGISRWGAYISYEHPTDGKDFRSLKDEDTLFNVTLERSLEILAIPKRTRKKAAEPVRSIGLHPDDNELVNIFVGPYGPYVKHLKTNASIPKDMNVDDVTLDQAVDLLEAKAKNKGKRKSRRKTKKR